MKKFSKHEEMVNGRIIVMDFKDLEPLDFQPLYNLSKGEIRSETILCAPDGRLFVNRKRDGYDFIAQMFKTLMVESKTTLLKYEREYKKIYPHIKNFDDWAAWAATEPNKENVPVALGVLLVPIELKRREIEKGYYGKIATFPH